MEGVSSRATATRLSRRFNVEPAPLPLLKKMHEERTGDGVVLERMPRHRDLAESLRTYLEVAGVNRPELFMTDKTRKAITFHDLRATGLTWMAIRGDEPLRIMQRAGHESFATTQLYVREAEATYPLRSRDSLADYASVDARS
jgi:integrase